MSNPTTYFGWQMPEPTDLVTDLPADFEVFGQAVDTDFQDLLGGTTGQLLSKTSATDLDFTWVTPNAGDITGVTAGIGISGGGSSGDVTVTNSMATAFTTSGDLIQATGSGTFARLGTGTNGQYLTTNGTTNSWGSISAGGMTLLSTTSLTGTSVSITSISQAYNELVIYAYGMTSNTSNTIFAMTPYNGSTSYSTYTLKNGNYADPTTIHAGSGGRLSDDYSGQVKKARANANNFWKITIPDYAAAYYKGYFVYGTYMNEDGSQIGRQIIGGTDATLGIDRLDFSIGGNTFLTGAVKIYGVK